MFYSIYVKKTKEGKATRIDSYLGTLTGAKIRASKLESKEFPILLVVNEEGKISAVKDGGKWL